MANTGIPWTSGGRELTGSRNSESELPFGGADMHYMAT